MCLYMCTKCSMCNEYTSQTSTQYTVHSSSYSSHFFFREPLTWSADFKELIGCKKITKNKMRWFGISAPTGSPGLLRQKSASVERSGGRRRTWRAVFEPISRMFCRDKEPLSPARYSCSRCHVCAVLPAAPRRIWHSNLEHHIPARSFSRLRAHDARSFKSTSAEEKKMFLSVLPNSFQEVLCPPLPDWVGPFLSCRYFMMIQ